MIELVEGVRQLIDISADLMGRQLVKGILQHAIEAGQYQLQRLLAVISAAGIRPFVRSPPWA